jgi:hypothetical protein
LSIAQYGIPSQDIDNFLSDRFVINEKREIPRKAIIAKKNSAGSLSDLNSYTPEYLVEYTVNGDLSSMSSSELALLKLALSHQIWDPELPRALQQLSDNLNSNLCEGHADSIIDIELDCMDEFADGYQVSYVSSRI